MPTDLLKSGEANPTTSASDCKDKLKSDTTIKADLFPDASSDEDSNKVRPALSAYEDDIRNYGGLGFDKDNWQPSILNCDATTPAPTESPTKSPTGTPTEAPVLPCTCGCHLNPYHPIRHATVNRGTYCEAQWGTSSASRNCPTEPANPWTGAGAYVQSCGADGGAYHGCCNRQCCDNTGPHATA